MTLDATTCYRALRARDRRFDGAFFVAVATTGIYCRPICPARVPALDRCTFYQRAAEAERAGYRACFRCRPELAPGLAPVDSIPRLVRDAVSRIDQGFLNEASIDTLARNLGVTARHLRRSMEAELGVSPVGYAQTRRLALAKQLLHDTSLSLAEVAFASGFASVRRFNTLFRARFGCAPSKLRSSRRRERGETISLRLDYRPPLDWPALIAFLRGRAIPGVERVDGFEYSRTVAVGGKAGTIAVRPAADDRPALIADVSLSLVPKLTVVVDRLRTLFDLDAEPTRIAEHLSTDAVLRPLVRKRKGLRVPGAFDPFEVAVRAILGQQVSVRAATTLSGRLASAFGLPMSEGAPALETELTMRFPDPATLAAAPLAKLCAIGMPESRARTILGLADAVAHGRVDLTDALDPERTIAQLVELPGIGPWTANYLAMRGLHWPNAFPAADLGVLKALGVTNAREASARAAGWQPWRAYGVIHLWTSLSDGG